MMSLTSSSSMPSWGLVFRCFLYLPLKSWKLLYPLKNFESLTLLCSRLFSLITPIENLLPFRFCIQRGNSEPGKVGLSRIFLNSIMVPNLIFLFNKKNYDLFRYFSLNFSPSILLRTHGELSFRIIAPPRDGKIFRPEILFIGAHMLLTLVLLKLYLGS